MYTVYVMTDAQRRIIAINSDEFMASDDGWVQIDSGEGDRYHHAQGNYLPSELWEPDGVSRWMTAPASLYPEREAFTRYLFGGEEWGVYLRTASEMQADRVSADPPESTAEDDVGDRLTAVEQQIDMILAGVVSDE